MKLKINTKRIIIFLFIAILSGIVISTYNLQNHFFYYVKAQSLEQSRIEELRKELNLVLPESIDNPNYKITFKNPSKEDIDLTIDGKVYKNIKSPFKLPNLTIGPHTLIFKYTNKNGVLRLLTLNIVVIPRQVQFSQTQKTLFKKPEPIKISGMGIPNGQILLVVDGNISKTLNVNKEGYWEYILPDVSVGKHNIIIFSIKNGIVNTTGKTLTIEYIDETNKKENKQEHNETQPVSFIERIQNFVDEYRDYLIYAGAALSGIILAYLILIIHRYIKNRQEEKTLAELLKLEDDSSIVDVLNDTKTSTDSTKTKKSIIKKSTTKKRNTSKKKTAQKPSRNKIKKTDEPKPKATTKSDDKIKVSKKVLTKEEFLETFKKSKDKK